MISTKGCGFLVKASSGSVGTTLSISIMSIIRGAGSVLGPRRAIGAVGH